MHTDIHTCDTYHCKQIQFTINFFPMSFVLQRLFLGLRTFSPFLNFHNLIILVFCLSKWLLLWSLFLLPYIGVNSSFLLTFYLVFFPFSIMLINRPLLLHKPLLPPLLLSLLIPLHLLPPLLRLLRLRLLLLFAAVSNILYTFTQTIEDIRERWTLLSTILELHDGFKLKTKMKLKL